LGIKKFLIFNSSFLIKIHDTHSFQRSRYKSIGTSNRIRRELKGDIIQIKDDYAVGPLQNIYVGEGIENRKNWWRGSFGRRRL
jgi:hypothetical protein